MRGKPSILETLWKAYAGRAKARVFSRGERLRRRKARKKKKIKDHLGRRVYRRGCRFVFAGWISGCIGLSVYVCWFWFDEKKSGILMTGYHAYGVRTRFSYGDHIAQKRFVRLVLCNSVQDNFLGIWHVPGRLFCLWSYRRGCVSLRSLIHPVRICLFRRSSLSIHSLPYCLLSRFVFSCGYVCRSWICHVFLEKKK